VALLRLATAHGYTDYRNIQSDPDLRPLRGGPGFSAILGDAHFDRSYCAVWYPGGTMEAAEAHGLGPVGQAQRARQLAARGWRPVALSVAQTVTDGPLVTASLWQRPSVPPAETDRLARRQAQAAATLLHLGRPDRVWPLLRHSPDPTRRTWLVHRLAALGVDARLLWRRYQAEPDISARRALLLSLGEYGTPDRLGSGTATEMIGTLFRQYRGDPDPGLHAAIDWLMRRGGADDTPFPRDGHPAEALDRADRDLAGREAGPRLWHVNRHGDTMAVFPSPEPFLMGSPMDQPGRSGEEIPHLQSIGRTFALATREVTLRQFKAFLRTGAARLEVAVHDRDGPDAPVHPVSWLTAIKYCRWLSEQEGVPPHQMCYPSIADIEMAEAGRAPLRLPPDLLSRTGYRLPTAAEWEYACRAGSRTRWFHGESEELLGRYAWYVPNSGGHARPAGQKKPNDFGLFDMPGNIYEWCHDVAADVRPLPDGQALEDPDPLAPELTRGNEGIRNMRGGSYDHQSERARSGWRFASAPVYASTWGGFRVARTIRAAER
jgi:formylglycine-generating enzyme required for sulfatase activity